MIPILKYVPEWVPGAGFQRLAKAWKKETDDTFDLPWAAAKELFVSQIDFSFGRRLNEVQTSGSYSPSFTSFSLEALAESNATAEAKAKEEEAVKNTAASMFLGPSESNMHQSIAYLLSHIQLDLIL